VPLPGVLSVFFGLLGDVEVKLQAAIVYQVAHHGLGIDGSKGFAIG
jgi:hypothetical protein